MSTWDHLVWTATQKEGPAANPDSAPNSPPRLDTGMEGHPLCHVRGNSICIHASYLVHAGPELGVVEAVLQLGWC